MSGTDLIKTIYIRQCKVGDWRLRHYDEEQERMFEKEKWAM
jgi:hypothetical protein